MSAIRSLAPKFCPTCGAENSYRAVDGVVRCTQCGKIPNTALPKAGAEGDSHISDAELDALFGDEAQVVSELVGSIDGELQRRRESYRPSYLLRHKNKDDIDPYCEAIFSTAMDCVGRKDWDGAIHNLRRVLDYNRDITDANLWLGRLLADDKERREHLQVALAVDMQNGEVLRELMILDGELAPGQVLTDYTMPETRTAGTVAAQSRGVKCPRCGAPKLNADPARPGLLICGACGHEIAAPMGGGDRNVARAMLKKRAQAVEWVVGARILSCNGCGAQRTFAADQLAELCPFCGSRNVITQDALNSLAQPDAVVPFALDEQQATDAVREALTSGMERLKGWFIDNRAHRIMAEAVYLPYWSFDAAVDVTRTYQIRDKQNSGSPLHLSSSPTITDQFGDAMYNVLIPGVAQPPAWLLARLGKFESGHTLAYTPEAIAQHGAEIYTKDFDKASMDAHTVVSQAMRDKYGVNNAQEVTTSVFSIVKPIMFRLLLVPVWAITIHERDGDVRPALVNGQTGIVAFGKAAKLK